MLPSSKFNAAMSRGWEDYTYVHVNSSKVKVSSQHSCGICGQFARRFHGRKSPRAFTGKPPRFMLMFSLNHSFMVLYGPLWGQQDLNDWLTHLTCQRLGSFGYTMDTSQGTSQRVTETCSISTEIGNGDAYVPTESNKIMWAWPTQTRKATKVHVARNQQSLESRCLLKSWISFQSRMPRFSSVWWWDCTVLYHPLTFLVTFPIGNQAPAT